MPDARRLDFIMDVGNLAWWEMNCETGAMFFHRRMTDMLDYEPDQFTSYADFSALLHPDDIATVLATMRALRAGAKPEYRIEYRIKAKTGEYRWFEDVGRITLRDNAGLPITMTGVVFDVTARKHAEEAVKISEERFRKMFHGHSAVKMVIDPKTGAIVDANAAAVNFYGWPIEELKQMFIQQINDLHPDDLKDRMASAIASPNARFEFRHRRADGSTRDVEVYSNRIEIAGRAYLYSIIHDITERKRTEEALHAIHDRLRRAEEFARFGHWEYSLDERIIHASDGARQVYGFANADIPLSVVQGCALSEYRPGLDRALRDLIAQNVPLDQEFKICRNSDGAIVHVHSRAEYDARTRKVFGVVQDITERQLIEEERELLIEELQRTIEQVKTLKGILPICSSCKKIRDDQGYWEQVDAYVTRHTDALFSHGICPACAKEIYGEFLSDEE